jgi:predicted Zn-dependent peptidase
MPSLRVAATGEVMTARLANGLQVVVEELPFARSVAIGCVVNAGSRYESRELSGVSHLIEHLLFRGSAAMPSALDIAVAVECLGGMIDAYTDADHAVCHIRAHPEGLAEAAGILADLLVRPALRPDDLEPEREVVIGEICDSAENPAEEAQRLAELAMWGDHPLGWGIAGTQESVRALTAEQLVRYWETHYTAANCVVTVAGAAPADAALEAIQDAFGDMPPGRAVPPPSAARCRPGPDLAVAGPVGDRAAFAIGLPGVAYDHPGRWAMHCFNAILGGSMSSRLFQEIRGRLGLAYQIGSRSLEHGGTGMWLVTGSLARAELPGGLAAVGAVLGRARDHGFGPAEVQRVTRHGSRGIELLLEDTWAVAERNGVHVARDGVPTPVEEVLTGLASVDATAVHRIARQVIDAGYCHLTAVGVEPADGLLDALVSALAGEPSP